MRKPILSSQAGPAAHCLSRPTAQLTLPIEALRAAGLEPGDDVRVQVVGPGRLELVRADELVDEFAGVFDATVYPDGYLDELRREWP
jgi:bifunctional DNA-binding transcriptional regulator/antitoxin component of YhaV-PrlF toxin-antitoxin module